MASGRLAVRSAPPPSSSPSPSPPPTPALLPSGGRTLLPAVRVVAYYGAAGLPALGVLGSGPPERVWPRLAAATRPFQVAGRPALAAYELIVVIARGSPGPDRLWRSRVPGPTIDRYVAAAHRLRALLILDVQPGRANFLSEVLPLERWLRDPYVALALDPEWRMGPHEVPGRTIGRVGAAEVNAVSAWLDALTVRNELPQKLLLIHQFTPTMMLAKPAVLARPHLALVFNMDGFGGQRAKLEQYARLAADRRFGLGIKLFYHQDVGLLSPAAVVDLAPAPDIVEYQ